MPIIKCAFPTCDYSTDNIDAAGVQLATHGYSHMLGQAAPPHGAAALKPEKVKRPMLEEELTT